MRHHQPVVDAVHLALHALQSQRDEPILFASEAGGADQWRAEPDRASLRPHPICAVTGRAEGFMVSFHSIVSFQVRRGEI